MKKLIEANGKLTVMTNRRMYFNNTYIGKHAFIKHLGEYIPYWKYNKDKIKKWWNKNKENILGIFMLTFLVIMVLILVSLALYCGVNPLVEWC